MTAVTALAFPGGRVLAGWWRQLAPLRPRAFWVGHLFLHRVEALVATERPGPLDSFSRLVLRALALAPDKSLVGVDAQLHLGPEVLHQVLGQLRGEGLTRNEANTHWDLTPLGRSAVDTGTFPRVRHERRVFHFLAAGPSLHFVPLNARLTAPWKAAEGWQFDPAVLEACLGKPAEWKRRFGFPEEVSQLLGMGGPRPAADGVPAVVDWRRVVLDRPEHLLAVFVLVSAEQGQAASERLLALPVRQEGWVLQTAEPALRLDTGWQEVFPEAAAGPPAEECRQAWRAWAQPRSLPPAEVEACRLERQDHLLRVTAPRKLVDRLRSARSDALKGEAWVLAGEGNVRAALLLEIQETAG
jgi:hypothetical protein